MLAAILHGPGCENTGVQVRDGNMPAQDLPTNTVCASTYPHMSFVDHSSDQGKEMGARTDAVTTSYWYTCKHIFVLEKYLVYIIKSTPLMKHFLYIPPCTDMLL